MPKEQKIEYSQLETGHEFSPISYRLDSSTVAIYCQAVGETSSLYQNTELIPPMAVAAHALRVLLQSISLPPGTIHVSQELEFIETVTTKDTITSYAKVSRKQDRSKLHLLTVDFNVFNRDRKAVLAGKVTLILPEPGEE